MVRELWHDIASRKRAEVAKQLPSEWKLPSETLASVDPNADTNVMDLPRACGLLTAKELDITENYDATELIAKMASGELSSTAVTLSFCKRAAIAHQLVRVWDNSIQAYTYIDRPIV